MNYLSCICRAKTESGEVSFPFGFQIQSFNLILIFQILRKMLVSIRLSVFRFSKNFHKKSKFFAKKFVRCKKVATFAVSKYHKRRNVAGRKVSIFCVRTYRKLNTTAPCRGLGNRLGVLLMRLRQHVAQFFVSKTHKYGSEQPFIDGRQPATIAQILSNLARIGKKWKVAGKSFYFLFRKEIVVTFTFSPPSEPILQLAVRGRFLSFGGAALRGGHAAVYYFNRYNG